MIRKNLFLQILFYFLLISKCYSLIEVDITRGNLNPLPIAVSPLFSDKISVQELKIKTNKENLGEEISNIVVLIKRKIGFSPLFMKNLLFWI